MNDLSDADIGCIFDMSAMDELAPKGSPPPVKMAEPSCRCRASGCGGTRKGSSVLALDWVSKGSGGFLEGRMPV